jgi:hypothetical protein
MSDTFICVDELGGDCPIHGRRGSVHGSGAVRHACGCPCYKGETPMTGTKCGLSWRRKKFSHVKTAVQQLGCK